MLVNLAAGIVMLALCLDTDANRPDRKRWVVGFLMSSALALMTGLHMILTWPLPGSFHILFGETSVFFCILLLGLAFFVCFGLDLSPWP